MPNITFMFCLFAMNPLNSTPTTCSFRCLVTSITEQIPYQICVFTIVHYMCVVDELYNIAHRCLAIRLAIKCVLMLIHIRYVLDQAAITHLCNISHDIIHIPFNADIWINFLTHICIVLECEQRRAIDRQMLVC